MTEPSEPDNLIVLADLRRVEEPVEPQEAEPDFVLDDPPADGLGGWVINQVQDPVPRPFVLSPTDAYVLLRDELMRRGMASVVITQDQFNHEWTDGIERTVMYMAPGGTDSMMVRGCPVSAFTEITEYFVKTTAQNPPTALERFSIGNRTFCVLLSYGAIRSVFEETSETTLDGSA